MFRLAADEDGFRTDALEGDGAFRLRRKPAAGWIRRIGLNVDDRDVATTGITGETARETGNRTFVKT